MPSLLYNLWIVVKCQQNRDHILIIFCCLSIFLDSSCIVCVSSCVKCCGYKLVFDFYLYLNLPFYNIRFLLRGAAQVLCCYVLESVGNSPTLLI
ncbi:hypothetical protein DAI22_12g104100 [Oryza sativa Japonica Group]|nr:hypothetical protein DAI22_12g104100 [Oryza sativa Japonica Group]